MKYNAVLKRVEVIELNGKFVVIDSHGKIQSRWADRHHALEHKNLINSLIDGAKRGEQKRYNNRSFK